MSDNRLFALNSESYPEAVCALIQKYIDHKVKEEKADPETSVGVRRARALLKHINEVLLQQRQFTAKQLMWIIYDYCSRDHGCWPLETSLLLRGSLMHQLCQWLHILELDITKCAQSYDEGELDEDALPVTRPGVFNIKRINEPFNFATEFLIKQRLVMTAHPVVRSENFCLYSQKLIESLDDYIAWAEKKFFRSEGITRAKNIKTLITTEWLPYEKLDEKQLMWRILEHIELPHEDSYGIFGTSIDCRAQVLRGLCDYLDLTQTVKAKTKKAVNLHYTQMVGLFYLDRIEDDFEKQNRVCIEEIKRELIARTDPRKLSSRERSAVMIR